MNRMFIMTAVLCACLPCAPAQQVPVPKAQLQRDIWISNAKFNIDTKSNYQLVGIAAALHSAYTADPTLTTADLRSVIHTTEVNLATWQASQGSNANPDDIYQKTISLMADATSSVSFKAAASIAKDLLSVLPSATPEDDWKMINAFQSSVFSVNRARETEVLDSVYSDAQSSTAFQSAFDSDIGPALNALTSDSPGSILDHNPQFAQGIALDNLTSLVKANGDTVTMSISDLQNNLNTHIGALANVVSGDSTLLSTLNQQQVDMNAYLKNAAAQQQASQMTQHQQKLDQLQIEAADAAFQIFGKIIPGTAGAQVAQAGQVAVKIASSISDFVNNTSNISTGLGAAVLTGNLLSAATSLSSIFGGGPSQMDVISSQLTKLSDQISGLQQDMDTRLNRIDSALAQIYDQQSKDFVKILSTLDTVQNTLALVRGDLFALSAQLTGVQNQIIAVLENMDQKAFYNDYNEYLRYYELKGIPMTEPAFDSAEKEYSGAILSGNAPPEVDTQTLGMPGDSTITKTLRGDLDNPIFNALRPEEINFVLASAGASAAGGPVVNPHLWTIATTAYLDLANQPKTVSATGSPKPQVLDTFICQTAKTDEFIAAGTSIKEAMTNVAVAPPMPDGSYDNAVFGPQIVGYDSALASLMTKAQDAQNQWVQKAGFDPWLGPDQDAGQLPSFGTNSITPCSAADKANEINTPDVWGANVSIVDVGFLKGTFTNASHFTHSDQGFSLCLTNMSYSTFTQQDHPQNGSIRPTEFPNGPCRYRDIIPGAPCIIHHYSFTFALTATARLSYQGLHLSDFTFTTSPWSVQDSDFPAGVVGVSYAYEVPAHWDVVSASIQSSLATATLAADSDAALNLAQEDMHSFLAMQRKQLISEAWFGPVALTGPDKSDLRKSFDTLSDYKTLMWALSQIGLPTSFDSDQIFRAYISDSDTSLLDRIAWVRKLGYLVSEAASPGETKAFNLSDYSGQAKGTSANFRLLLSQKIDSAKKNGGDLPEGIASGLLGLERLKASHDTCQVQTVKAKKARSFWSLFEFWHWF